uniref:Uncharacterized protein n=1 Tax=Arundo donax TaxID=35708 RepID=A0A0A8YKI3_ARUDO
MNNAIHDQEQKNVGPETMSQLVKKLTVNADHVIAAIG